jgi:hypothetical protein
MIFNASPWPGVGKYLTIFQWDLEPLYTNMGPLLEAWFISTHVPLPCQKGYSKRRKITTKKENQKQQWGIRICVHMITFHFSSIPMFQWPTYLAIALEFQSSSCNDCQFFYLFWILVGYMYLKMLFCYSILFGGIYGWGTPNWMSRTKIVKFGTLI